MRLKHLIRPTWMVNSPYNLEAEDLLRQGIRGMIVDLDNTLLAWNQAEGTPQLSQWVKMMNQAGISCFILSNNYPERVKRVADPLELPFKANALKPLTYNFKKALKALGLRKEEVVVIGDQIMTDVIGANRLGLSVILVKPILNHDNVYTYVNRKLERYAFKILGIDSHSDWGEELGNK